VHTIAIVSSNFWVNSARVFNRNADYYGRGIMKQNDIIEQVRQTVDGFVDGGDPSYGTAMILVAALFVGPNVDAIVSLTGSAASLVENVACRMRASGMWTDEGAKYDDWFCNDGLRGIAAFALDLGIGEGFFIRTCEKTSTGDWIYKAVDPTVSQK
jgi:hypothetical protein